jgi:5'-nucleotidase
MQFDAGKSLAVLILLAGVSLFGCENKQKQKGMTKGPPQSQQPEPMSFGETAEGPQSGGPAQPQPMSGESGSGSASSGSSSPSQAEGSSGASQAEESGGASPERMSMPPQGESSSGASAGSSASEGDTYTIQEGDTLYSIAKQFYGDGQKWTKIDDANPDVDPKHMPVGEEIAIPPE